MHEKFQPSVEETVWDIKQEYPNLLTEGELIAQAMLRVVGLEYSRYCLKTVGNNGKTEENKTFDNAITLIVNSPTYKSGHEKIMSLNQEQVVLPKEI